MAEAINSEGIWKREQRAEMQTAEGRERCLQVVVDYVYTRLNVQNVQNIKTK